MMQFNSRLKPNFEIRESFRRRPYGFRLIEDIPVHLFVQFDEETIHFLVGPFEDELHPAVGKIADEAGDVEPRRDRARGIAKPHSLHAAGENNLALFRFVIGQGILQ